MSAEIKKTAEKESFLAKPAVQSIIASLLCIIVGLLIGYVALLFINAQGATDAIITIIKNYFTYPTKAAALKYCGNTLVKAAPLLMCALSIQFCYQAGLFNIGAAGQYVVGAGASLFCALKLGLPWHACLLAALVAGGVYGVFVGVLKAYLNVNEVISGIMLNWIGLYSVNMMLNCVKETASPYTVSLEKTNASAVLPSLGLEKLFSNNKYVTIAIPLAVIIAILLKVILSMTVFGYEIKATGIAKDAAKYSGMKEKRNVILTLFIGGALAGIGAAFLFLTGYEQWSVTQSSVPGMGFNGIAATFLGGLDPIGTIFASYFIQHITSGGSYLDKNAYPSQISDFISAIIIYLCGFVLFFKFFLNSRIVNKKNNAEGGNK
ncbi:simple sugar transport system permease protein [Butyrivibrio hungatei]|uniref:Simple sugar transport system permease protein n=1 Tax=Butyrivibrio hungatei TaxID=185008 RepID=A0A1G5EIR4_9FIRM|nr:ABC transporter permease [Butyrivibrio hungatei]MBQ4218485.1 ABC transporter permease [Butyrivibrio sp.]MEE3469612.1 ABC transporter permease [Butyrivibrio hungatei]SCY26913.1 simple sugar transport system permease protein [Butyrivibrio hungatei]